MNGVTVISYGSPNYMIDMVADGFMNWLGRKNTRLEYPDLISKTATSGLSRDLQNNPCCNPDHVHLYSPLFQGENILSREDTELFVVEVRRRDIYPACYDRSLATVRELRNNFPKRTIVAVDGEDDFVIRRELLPYCDVYFKRDYLNEWGSYDKIKPISFAAFPLNRVEIPRDKNGGILCSIGNHADRLRFAESTRKAGLEFCEHIPWNDYVKLLSSWKIGISVRGAGWDTARYWEIPYFGALLFSQRMPILIPDNFTEDEAVFFSEPEELESKLKYYLEHPAELEEKRVKGVQACMSRHLTIHRAKYIEETVKSVAETKVISLASKPKLKVGVVIPAYASGERVTQLWNSIINTTKNSVTCYLFLHSRVPDVVNVCEQLATLENVKYFPYGVNRGLSLSWNDGLIESYTNDGNDVTVIVNDDIIFGENDFDRLVQTAYENPDKWFTTGRGFDGYGNVQNMLWGCFILNKIAIEKVGYFDENIFPAYYEDIDYNFRALLAGLGEIMFVNTSIMHYHNGSRKTSPEFSRMCDEAIVFNGTYHQRKWGTPNLYEPVFKHPFDNTMWGCHISLEDRHHPYLGYNRNNTPFHRNDLPEFFTQQEYKLGVEVGVARGDYSEEVLRRWNGILYLVDAWKHLEQYRDTANGDDGVHEANYQSVKQKFAGNENVVLVRKLSLEAAQDFADGSLDWVYIDANHSYEAVKADLAAWYPKVRNGGTISGHDYFITTDDSLRGDYGVKKAVDEFASNLRLNVSSTAEQYPSWWIVKQIKNPTHRGELPILFSQMGYKSGVEVGVCRGDYSQCLADGWNGMLYLVDSWRHFAEGYSDVANREDAIHEANYQFVKQRFAGNIHVIPVRKLSVEAAADFADGSLDWVYIDANHSHEAVKADLEAWYPKVRSGGIISGHDYAEGAGNLMEYGVKPAVDEFVATLGLQVHVLSCTSWWVIKP